MNFLCFGGGDCFPFTLNMHIVKLMSGTPGVTSKGQMVVETLNGACSFTVEVKATLFSS